jgi:hypothetical protein
MIGVDAFGAAAMGDGTDNVGLGYGVNGRLGYVLPIPVVHITPEIVLGYTRFPYEVSGPAAIDGSLSFVQAMAGARAAIGVGLKPFAFWHIGYVRAGVNFGNGSCAGGSTSCDSNGLTTEIGGGLDFTALPLLTVGIHGAYTYAADKSGPDSTKWILFGAHASLGF